MPRMTRLLPHETRYTLDASRVEKGPDGWQGEAVDRLAFFENLLEAMETRARDIPAELSAMRALGKEKTVTFRELTSQKMMVQWWLETAREYHISE